ncbi:MAG: hydroxymethylbilane synthase [Ferruginibacter sp.]
MQSTIKIGTRESELAVWQATQVQQQLSIHGIQAELVFIKSEGDIDLQTPLYEMGVQGIFTRSLDMALLNRKIDIAVHSMKDVPTQLPHGIVQAAVLKRGNYKDLLVYKPELDSVKQCLGGMNDTLPAHYPSLTIATSSVRRKAQWLNKFPTHRLENLRGNVNTRMKKLSESSWNGAIFAAAGLERIELRPSNAVELDWMLPAPAQGAIVIVCREEEPAIATACALLNDDETAICVKIERDFLRALMGGCSTPISALAELVQSEISGKKELFFRGNLLNVDGSRKIEIEKFVPLEHQVNIGATLAAEILNDGGQAILDELHANEN